MAMATSRNNLKVLKIVLAFVGVCAVFVSGIAVGSYVYGNLQKPIACAANKIVPGPVQPSSVQPSIVQPVVVGGVLLQGTVSAISDKSLTINSDQSKGNNIVSTTVTVTPETTIVQRVNLPAQQIDALMKKLADESMKSHAPLAPPMTYKEQASNLSDIKVGMPIGVVLAPSDTQKASNIAQQIYYYSAAS
jgi:hypothetical protein